MLSSRVIKYGDDINTDVIISAKYLSSPVNELKKHCFESIDKNFIEKVKKRKILVTGKNFGCGSSREHAALALKSAGVKCIIAKSFARIFFRNAVNIGLAVVESQEAAKDADDNDKIEIDLTSGKIVNSTKNKIYKIQPYPEFIQKIISSGGLVPYLKKTYV